MSLFWNTINSSRTTDYRGMADYTSEAADSAQADAHLAQDSASETNERLEQLLLVCSAMWELLRERTSLSEEDLIARVAENHARDCQMPKQPRKCPNCNRIIVQHHQKCIYCGTDVPADTAFNTV